MADLTPERQEWVDSLREVADAFEAHPELIGTGGAYLSIWWPPSAVAVVRSLGGAWTAEANDGSPRIVRKFGPHRLSVVVSTSETTETQTVQTAKVINDEIAQAIATASALVAS